MKATRTVLTGVLSIELVGRAARRRGAAGPRAVPVRSAPAVPTGHFPVGVLVPGASRRPGRREGLRDVGTLGGARRATDPLGLDSDERRPTAPHRRPGPVREPPPALGSPEEGARARSDTRCASCSPTGRKSRARRRCATWTPVRHPRSTRRSRPGRPAASASRPPRRRSRSSSRGSGPPPPA